MKWGKSAAAWSICQCLFQTIFVSVYFRHSLYAGSTCNAFLDLLVLSHFKNLKFARCVGRCQLQIALNLPKYALFIYTSHFSCFSKMCSFYIASLHRFLYAGGEAPFSAEIPKPTIQITF